MPPGVLERIGSRRRRGRRPTPPAASELYVFTGEGEETFARNQQAAVSRMAVVLDEQVPGWHLRITRPLDMRSVSSCVLGQIFEAESSNGYAVGAEYLQSRGISIGAWGVFSDPAVVPHWVREITARH